MYAFEMPSIKEGNFTGFRILSYGRTTVICRGH